VNYSTNNTIDISKWILTKQHINSEKKVRYIIPNGIRLEPGRELRIYAKLNGGAAEESTSYQKLVNNDLVSWGM
jgi:tetrahydrodipicolinate N-succinyltransferase